MKRVSFIFAATLIMAGVFAIPLFVFAQAQGSGPSQNKTCVLIESNGTRNELDTNDPNENWTRWPKVSVPIPGVTGVLECKDTATNQVERYNFVTDLGTYLAGLYQFFVGIVGILAAVMIMYGGIRWVLAAGNQSRIQASKSIIFSAIIGIVIAFTSYLLLFLLNPKLVNYENLALDKYGTVTGRGINGLSASCLSFGAQSVAATASTGICARTGDIDYATLCSYFSTTTGANGKPVIPSRELACGDTGIIEDPGAYFGTACTGSLCHDANSDGVPDGLCVPDQGRCVYGYLVGTVSYVGNAFPEKIKIEAVCNNGERKTTWRQFTNCLEFSTDVSRMYYSSLENVNDGCPSTTEAGIMSDATSAFNGYIDDCSDELGLGGFYLNVEINDDQGYLANLFPTTDDNFAVDKNCQVINTFKDPKKYTAEDWKAAIAQGRLFSVDDFINPADGRVRTSNVKVCNFNIDRQSFIAR